MIPCTFEVKIALFKLENDLRLTETLRWPELTGLDREANEPMIDDVRVSAWRVARWLWEVSLSKRHLPDEVETQVVRFDLDPPTHNKCWQRPLPIRFDAVVWQHPPEGWIATVPVLDVSVIVQRREDIPEVLERHIREVLALRRDSRSLMNLMWLQRPSAMELMPLEVTADLDTPAEKARTIAGREEEARDDLFVRLGLTDMSRERLEEAYEVDRQVEQLAECFQSAASQSVLLVGPSGVGKTAVWHETCRRVASISLRGTPLWETLPSILVSSVGGFKDWADRCEQLIRLAEKEKPVIHLGNLWELTQVGTAEGRPESLADYLLPAIVRGQLRVVCECTTEQFAVIERSRPNLLEPLTRIDVAPPDPSTAVMIYHQATAKKSPARAAWQAKRRLERQGITPVDPTPTITDAALELVDALHRRYASYSAIPGRPLRFLKNLLEDSGSQTCESDLQNKEIGATVVGATKVGATEVGATAVARAFSHETGLPAFLLDRSVAFDPVEARHWFTRRVVGQDHAVDTVVDLIATVKTQLSRPDRPIASLLFVGPTGVGKTEMAKTLAQFLYSDPSRMVRIDMSEYADPLAAERLISGGAASEGILTARVRQQPFGVVLLDEFEKADRAVFDLLLQVLGEGRLTDAAGRLADFRNTVIILTSNLGVDKFGVGGLGFSRDQIEGGEASEHFTEEVRRFLRPEMMNRIDRIVSFDPLSPETLQQIAQSQIDRIAKLRGLQSRDVQIEIGEGVVDRIVQLGYDPRYGARPIRRAIERHLLIPLGEGIGRYDSSSLLRATITTESGEIRVKVAKRSNADHAQSVRKDLHTLFELLADLRRQTQALKEHRCLYDLRAKTVRASSLKRRLDKEKRSPSADEQRFIADAANRTADLIDTTERIYKEACELEEIACLANLAGEPIDRQETRECYSLLRDEFLEHRQTLYRADHQLPDSVQLLVMGERSFETMLLARLYKEVSEMLHSPPQLRVLELAKEPLDLIDTDRDIIMLGVCSGEMRKKFRSGAIQVDAEFVKSRKAPVLVARAIDTVDDYTARVSARRQLGILLSLDGESAAHRFESEAGLHRLLNYIPSRPKMECTVDVFAGPLADYFPSISQQGVMINQVPAIRRVINNSGMVQDPIVDYRGTFRGATEVEEIARLIELALERRIEEWYRQ